MSVVLRSKAMQRKDMAAFAVGKMYLVFDLGRHFDVAEGGGHGWREQEQALRLERVYKDKMKSFAYK